MIANCYYTAILMIANCYYCYTAILLIATGIKEITHYYDCHTIDITWITYSFCEQGNIVYIAS